MPHRILVTQKFASLGGGQVSLLHHLEHLNRDRFTPLVAVSNEGWLTAELDRLGIEWTLVPFGHWSNPLAFLQSRKVVERLVKLIKEHDVQLVHANEHWVGPPSYLAARRAGIPVVCHFRTGLEDLTARRIAKYRYGRFDRVIAVAEVLRRQLATHVADPARVLVVRDGVEIPDDVSARTHATSRIIAINVGALYPVKGQAQILEQAIPWLRQSNRHYLVFVGGTRADPSYAEGMRQTILEEHDLEAQVYLLGSRTDVPRLLGFAEVLIAYSTVEGVPRVVMEAMAAGRPVIVSNTPGMEEVVLDGEVGRIIDPDSGSALSETLSELSTDRSRWRAMGQHARSRAKEKYSTKAMSDAIQAAYDELLWVEENA